MGQPPGQGDASGWWAALSSGGFSWRWFTSPRLYFRPGLEYTSQGPFTVFDGMGRLKQFENPIDCFIDPETGKIETLYVQSTNSICALSQSAPNATWKRTVIRNVSPMFLRAANLPFRFIPPQRRHDRSLYTTEDWWIVLLMWIPAVLAFSTLFLIPNYDTPPSKSEYWYLPLLYRGCRYPRLARNLLENRPDVSTQLANSPSWNAGRLDNYRTFRPRYLNYLVERVNANGNKSYASVRRPVRPDEMTPYVLVAYASAHFPIAPGGDGEEIQEQLRAVAIRAAIRYFSPLPVDLQANPRAFWLAHTCMPPEEFADENGKDVRIDVTTPQGKAKSDAQVIQDIYSISDIVRAAQHVIVAAGNRYDRWDDDALKVWGDRVWTLPEIILSQGDTVTVMHSGIKDGQQHPTTEFLEIPKTIFPTYAWRDANRARQLIEHFGNLQLSRIELVKITLECLMSRSFRQQYKGDRSYVMMGLLRIRPPIDQSDSSFQAFARLSLPQDNDRLMERMICLLPDSPEEDWELMTDQYKASLWDIYPETQVCGVGENDTVIIDGARAAQIQWSMFSPVRTATNFTGKRWLFMQIVVWCPILFYTSISLAAAKVSGGVPLLIIVFLLLILPSPYFVWALYGGKLWQVEPCFFGIEGYVPKEIIEEKLFGLHLNRLSWSTCGSPLSRHREGSMVLERSVSSSDITEETATLLHKEGPATSVNINSTSIGSIPTYPVEALDPTHPCSHCAPIPGVTHCAYHHTAASLQQYSHSPMGQLKVFTLVDTFNMTCTLFFAVRPPTVLMVAGSEGGMKRAIAASFDAATGTLYRETVLRIPTPSAARMEALPRARLGLKRPFLPSDVRMARR